MDISHFPNYKEGGKNGIPEHGKSSFRLPSPGLKDGLHRTDIHHLTRSGCPRWWEEMRLHLSPKGEKKCDGIFYICHDSGRRKTVFTGAPGTCLCERLGKLRQQSDVSSRPSSPGSNLSPTLWSCTLSFPACSMDQPHSLFLVLVSSSIHTPKHCATPARSSSFLSLWFQAFLSPSITGWKFRQSAALQLLHGAPQRGLFPDLSKMALLKPFLGWQFFEMTHLISCPCAFT